MIIFHLKILGKGVQRLFFLDFSHLQALLGSAAGEVFLRGREETYCTWLTFPALVKIPGQST